MSSKSRLLSFAAAVMLCAAIATAQQKPYGLEKFVPVDTSRLMGSPDPLPPLELENAFPNLRFERPLQILQAGDGTNRMFVVTQRGVIYVFPDRPNATEQERKVFLDWSKVAALVENEEGMMGLAFHPKFKENGLIYVYYTKRPLQSVLARFRVSKDDPDRVDPDTFEILLNFPQPYWNHNGGSLEFGPDGYLYLGLGDGGSGGDPHRNGQNLNTFLGKILRMDVDREDPGLKYSIPKDNPFADREGVKKEIWAYGVRNIWRLSFDRLTGALWAGDVGQDKYEEVDVIVKGGNYGWNLREGMHDFRRQFALGDEKLIDPIIDYGRSVGQCVIGGVVYRGKLLPELDGAYLYCDFNTGHVWALRYNGEKMTSNLDIVRAKREISSFGQDDAGEVLMTCFDGSLYKFRKAQNASEPKEKPFPRRLSETGFFTSTKTMTPAPGLIPYDVNVPLWSDGAAKERYIALPEGTTIKFSPDGQWEFPAGAVLVKSFFLETKAGDPSSRRRLETRFMVHKKPQPIDGLEVPFRPQQWIGYTYLWNDEQTDATLLDAAVTRDYRVKTAAGELSQSWYYPSRADCMNCHTPAAGFVLGLNTRQFNRQQNYGAVTDNQIRALDHLGVFQRMTSPPDTREAYPDWNAAIRQQNDATQTAALARSYLDVNCSICHCPGGTSDNSLDMCFHTSLSETKLIGTPPAKGDYGPAGSKIITPGDPAHSILLTRMKTRGEGKMPNVATLEVDDAAVEIIRQWIESMK
jgi:uncharacterized repeat protein (TIGR03806 family)